MRLWGVMIMNREQLEYALRGNIAIQFRIEVGDGWIPLVFELHQQLKSLDPTYEIIQVKEKFGILRVYFRAIDSSKYTEMEKITSVYEAHSGIICEFCGGFGKSCNLGGWMKTYCDQCYENWQKNDTRTRIYN